MESISVSGEVGGAGGAYSYSALKRLDQLWSSICSAQTGRVCMNSLQFPIIVLGDPGLHDIEWWLIWFIRSLPRTPESSLECSWLVQTFCCGWQSSGNIWCFSLWRYFGDLHCHSLEFQRSSSRRCGEEHTKRGMILSCGVSRNVLRYEHNQLCCEIMLVFFFWTMIRGNRNGISRGKNFWNL